MKKLIIAALSIITLLSCSEKKVKFTEYSGYYVNNFITPNKFLYVATNQIPVFAQYYGIAATMSNKDRLTEVDLSKNLIIAVADTVSDRTQGIKITSITKKDDCLKVDYIINTLKEPVPFMARYTVIAVVEMQNIKKVAFFHDGKEMKQVEVNAIDKEMFPEFMIKEMEEQENNQ